MNSSTTDIHILQFGTGNFLRGFFEPMIQDLNESGKPLKICIIQSTGGNSLEKLRKQNFEYHVLEAGIKNGKKVEKIQQITCIKDGLSLPNEAEKFLGFAENKNVKWIISNVTEAGLVWKNEGPIEKFAESFAGRLTQWLFKRFERLPQSETVILPCELLTGNGDILRDFVIRHAGSWLLPEEFFIWLDQQVYFFNNLVDRIVPGFPAHLNIPEKDSDPLLVQTEPYSFWAIQGCPDDVSRLPFIKSHSEVIIAAEIGDFALRKIRILNGCHTWMAVKNLWKTEVNTVGEFMGNSANRELMMRMLNQEIIPSIKLPKEELEKYAAEIFDRFANPFVAHQLRDIALNSVAKFKSRLLPVIEYSISTTKKVPPMAGKGLLYLTLSYLTKLEQVRDTAEALEFFRSIPSETVLEQQVKIVLEILFNLSWNEQWDALLQEILTENQFV